MNRSISSFNTVKLNEVCSLDKIKHDGAAAVYVGLEDITGGNGKFVGDMTPKAVKSASFSFNSKHVLYGRLRSYLNKVIVPDFTGHCSSEIFPLLSDPKRLDRSFLFYWLISETTCANINATSTGARMPRANMKKVMNFDIPLPPLDEQKRIVSILNKAFDGLDHARVNVEANLENARELFERSLLKTFKPFEIEDSLKLLKDVSITFGRGKSKHRPRNDKQLYGGPYPFIQTGDVRKAEHIITQYSQTYSEKGLSQSKLWPKGTICITIAANIAETCILGFDACFPDSIIGIVPDENQTQTGYVEYVLQFFQKRIQAQGKGAGQHNINLKTFETEYFPFPDLSTQISIVDRLDGIFAQVAKLKTAYEAKLKEITDLRQSLLQKAFSGELT